MSCGKKRSNMDDQILLFQSQYGDKQADAGWGCRIRLARLNSQSGANNGDSREIFIFPLQLTTSRIGNLTRLIHNLATI